MYTTDVGKTGQSLEFQIPMPVLILISHPLSSGEDRVISEVWWPMARLLVFVTGFKSSTCIICTQMMGATLGKVVALLIIDED